MIKVGKNELAGVFSLISAYVIWGFYPLYLKALSQVPSVQLAFHRVLWTFLFVLVFLIFSQRWNIRHLLSSRSNIYLVLISGIIINIQAFVFILAVQSNHIIETSLGNYISPLLTVLLGVIVIKEKLDVYKAVSMVLAAVGVLVIIFLYGEFPWYGISGALTFGLYGLVKKLTNLDSLIGIAIETGMIAPFSLVYLVVKQSNGSGFLGDSLTTTFLLIFLGVITAFPLWLFAQGVKKAPLSSVGFIQYLTPTISLLIGIIINKEPFPWIRLVGFSLIWIALFIYSYSLSIKFFRNSEKVN